jgi:hypothetical protein
MEKAMDINEQDRKNARDLYDAIGENQLTREEQLIALAAFFAALRRNEVPNMAIKAAWLAITDT